jgi:hypothetical protein
MTKSRKNWGEGFVLGLLIGLATVACLAGRQAGQALAGKTGMPSVRLTRRPLHEIEAARRLADLPTPSSAVH